MIPEHAWIKCNHGSGYNIQYESSKKNKIKRKIQKYYNADLWNKQHEVQYIGISKMILIEANIESADNLTTEYSFFTFSGKTEFVQILDNRHHRFEVTRNYHKPPFQLYSTVTAIGEKPPEYDAMLNLAEKLATGFPFVRVDFMLADHKIYFEELTFSPGSGFRRFSPDKYNYIFGDKLKDAYASYRSS